MERTAFIFPGQGSQFVGMGNDLKGEAAGLFEMANRVLGFDIEEICKNGPEEKLNLTENTQPAIVLISVILLEMVKKSGLSAGWCAGHSLGEYTAHFAAGTIGFEDLIRTVRNRGRYMQEAAPVGSGAMAAILGIGAEKVIEVCAEASGSGLVSPANYNSPEQTVIAGEREGVLKAMEIAKKSGAKRAILLPVSAPFHTELIKAAGVRLEEDFRAMNFSDPAVTVVTNVDASPVISAEGVKETLVRQVCSPVMWVESIEYMVAHGVSRFIEIGPGKVLSGLVRRITKGVEIFNVSDEKSLNRTLEAAERNG